MNSRVSLLALVLALAPGCTCRKGTVSPPPSDAPPSDAAMSDASDAALAATYELFLTRQTLVHFGSSTPLPLSQEFSEVVPALDPPLQRAASVREGKPVRIRVDREVPFGQLTRLMQAGLGARILQYEVYTAETSGALATITVPPPGAMPRGSCWSRIWVGPDQRMLVSIDQQATDAGSEIGMWGVVVMPKDGRVRGDAAVTILRRLDAKCKEGFVRLYTQPSATWGPVFDLARAIATANPKPNVSALQVQVPSLNGLDSSNEVYK